MGIGRHPSLRPLFICENLFLETMCLTIRTSRNPKKVFPVRLLRLECGQLLVQLLLRQEGQTDRQHDPFRAQESN